MHLLRTSGPSGRSNSLDLQPASPEQSFSGKALGEGWPVRVIASPGGLFLLAQTTLTIMVKNWNRHPEGL